METQIRQLKESDDRNSFDCSVGSMNDWLRNIANQHQKKNLSRTYVATVPDDPQAMSGYYVLAATSVETAGMPSTKLPRNVSAVLLAWLAVDNAAAFYRKYGFEPFTAAPLRLFLPVATIGQA